MLGSQLDAVIIGELQHYIFFDKALHVFRSNNIGDAKARQILAALIRHNRGDETALRMPSSREIATYVPPTPKLFIREQVQNKLYGISLLWEKKRQLLVIPLPIHVRSEKNDCKISVIIPSSTIALTMPKGLYSHLHSLVRNHKSLKQLALLTAIRWNMRDGPSDSDEMFKEGSEFARVVQSCKWRMDTVDVSMEQL